MPRKNESNGYNQAKIEDLEKWMGRIEGKLDEVQISLRNLFWKIGGISATISLIITIIMALIFKR